MGITIRDNIFLVVVSVFISVSNGSHSRGFTMHWYRGPFNADTNDYPITITVQASFDGYNSLSMPCESDNSKEVTNNVLTLRCQNCGTSLDYPATSYTCTDFATSSTDGFGAAKVYGSMVEVHDITTGTLLTTGTNSNNDIFYIGSPPTCCWHFAGSINYFSKINLSGTLSATNTHSPQAIMIPLVRIKRGCPTSLHIPIFDADKNANNPVTCRWADTSECGSLCTFEQYLPISTENTVGSCIVDIIGDPSEEGQNPRFFGANLGVAITVEDHNSAAANDVVNAVPLQFVIQYYSDDAGCDVIPKFVSPTTPDDLTVFTISPSDVASFTVTIKAETSDPNKENLFGLTINTQTAPEFVVPQGVTTESGTEVQKILSLDNSATYSETKNALQACFVAMDNKGRASEVRCITVCINEGAQTCNPNPCANGGTCNANTDGEFISCTCEDDWSGNNCQTNECGADNPCVNGGTCIFDDATGTFSSCTCPDSWQGDYCEMDECENSNPCLNEGTCISNSETGAIIDCDCTAGWTGDTCETALGCADVICENGGTCRADDNGDFDFCDCQSGWEDNLCQTGIGCFGDNDPCVQGTCVFDATDGLFVECDCDQSWTGEYCDIGEGCNPEVDPCVYGDCITNADGTFGGCACQGGFSGQYCDEEDDCNPNPCLNQGVCVVDADGTFTGCSCATGWTGERCAIALSCKTNPCGDGGVCVPDENGDQAYCKCKEGWTGDDCAIEWGICKAYGDPHYTSLDGTQYDFMGKCQYVLVRDCINTPGNRLFQVIQQNQPYGATASTTKELYITVRDQTGTQWTFDFLQGRDFRVNGNLTPPDFFVEDISIVETGNYLIFQLGNILRVQWDGLYNVDVGVISTWRGDVCGLCGNYNNDPTDDFTSALGVLFNNPADFGNSFAYNTNECTSDEEDPLPDPCNTDELLAQAQSVCGKILDPDGPFGAGADLPDAQVYYQSCLYDFCASEEVNSHCGTLAAFAVYVYGQNLDPGNWRRYCPECSLVCPAGTLHSLCVNLCPRTCANPDQEPCPQTELCREGCECPLGQIRQEDQCVASSTACGCFVNGVYYQSGTSWITENCGERCTCLNGQVGCTDGPVCDDNAVCEERNGRWDCYCIDGYRGDGETCTEITCPGQDGYDDLFECLGDECKWGCFESINYPEPYIENYSALYLISVPGASSITFKCDIKIEEGRDVLFAGSGPEPPFPLDSSTVNVYDGCQTVAFTITGDMAWLYFRSDRSVNQKGWQCCWHADDPCDPNPCENDGTCVTNSDGTYTCDCADGWTGPDCDTELYCCRAYGDPHYLTFDGKYYDFQGTCQYLLVGGTYQGTPFQVLQQNEPWSANSQVSVTKEITIIVGDYEILLKQDLVCCVTDTVNGITWVYDPCTLINSIPDVTVYSNGPGTCVYVKTDWGLTVKWDGRYNVDVWLVREFADLVEGLCGNMNTDPKDDCMNPDGELLNNPIEFGNSWAANPDDCTPVDPAACDYYPCDEIKDDLADYADELCSVLSDPWGPFAECHEVINPEPYECSCRYDLCATLPDLGPYCHTIALYASLCRRAGIRIRPWRNQWLCPYTCPVGSHYEFCTSDCPLTCADVAAGTQPGPCGNVCVEGCECDEGMVAEGRRCVPQAQCGCIDDDGNYRAEGEVWIEGIACIGEADDFLRRCVCNEGTVTCTNVQCDNDATCGINNGVLGCHCNEAFDGDGFTCEDNPCIPNPCGDLGTCVLDSDVDKGYYCVCKRGSTVNADGLCDTVLSYCTFQAAHHLMTFGGNRYNYQSTCQHVLLRSCEGDDFIVVYDGGDTDEVSAIGAIYVYINDATRPLICIRRRRKQFSIELNGSEVLPPLVNVDGVDIRLIGDSLVLWTDFGLEIKWSGHSNIEIAIPTADHGETCGMCREEEVTDANGAGKKHLFGACELLTYDIKYDPCKEVNPKKLQQAKDLCAILIDADGPFGNCHATINPDIAYSDCLFQMCATSCDRWTLCSIIASYAIQCQECNIKIGRWRDRKFCPLECPAGSRYNHCIPACPERCDNQGNNEPCHRPCVEGCECIDEFPVWGAYQCVPRNRCGCVTEGIYVDPGTTYTKPNCQETCTCHPDGTEWCVDTACSADASCVPVDSFFDIFYECRCDAGSSGDGLTCVDDPCSPNNPCQNGGTCYQEADGGYGCICFRGYDGPNCEQEHAYCGVAANNYYATFDGFYYNYFGGCSYILVENCRGSSPDFHVVQQMDATQWKPSTKAISFYAYGKRIDIWNHKYVSVNGQYVSLPYDCGQIQIEAVGGFVVIYTDFGVIVRYDGLHTAEVSVPSSYKDGVCGICGNYDGDAADSNEISGPEKKGFATLELFFTSYLYNDNHKPYEKFPCYDIDFQTYVGGYLDEDAEYIKEAQTNCSVLVDPTGPFANCIASHTREGDEPTMNEIFYLVCYQFTGLCSLDGMAGNTNRARCSVIDIYVQRCQESRNIDLQPWTEIAGCEMCPENAEYTLCGTACPLTCDDVFNPRGPDFACTRQCVPGCQCKKGYVLSGSHCVKPEKCGCRDNEGYYHELGEYWLTGDCSQKCFCNKHGQITCQKYGCLPPAECGIVNGKRDCNCPFPNIGIVEGGCVVDPCLRRPCKNGKCHSSKDGKYWCECLRGWTGEHCDKRLAYCSTHGNIHYKTFDGREYDYEGLCSYIFTTDCTPGSRDSDNALDVQIFNQRISDESRRPIIGRVCIRIKNTVIYLFGDGRCDRINDEDVILPVFLEEEGISVTRSGDRITVAQADGFAVVWDGKSNLDVSVPESYAKDRPMCGLCGVFNGIPEDDLITDESKEVDDPQIFGDSWKIAETKDCDLPPDDPRPECDESQYYLCGVLLDDNGPFSQCHGILAPYRFYGTCIADICATGDIGQLCTNLGRYADLCQEHGIPVGYWRSPAFCPYKCPYGQWYNPCITACPLTCVDLLRNEPYKDVHDVVPHCKRQSYGGGCECYHGYVLSGNKCVKPEDCGCWFEDRYYEIGAEILTDLCDKQCVCKRHNKVICKPVICEEPGVCVVVNGIQDCVCPDGSAGVPPDCDDDPCEPNPCNGNPCTPTGPGTYECCCPIWQAGLNCEQEYSYGSAFGDVHYLTMDTLNYNYQGGCSYILLEEDGVSPGFTIIQTNEKHTYNPSASITVKITIQIFGQEICLLPNCRLHVNGLTQYPPYMYTDGFGNEIYIYFDGENIGVWTSLGFIVIWDGKTGVGVFISNDYMNQVHGLLGNFDSDVSNERETPGGTQALSYAAFGDSWIYNSATCLSQEYSESDKYDPCREIDPLGVEEAREKCGVLLDNPGPFANCHDVIDVSPYYDACLFDYCAAYPKLNGSCCDSIAEYAKICKAAFVDVGPWRNEKICSCPKGFIYETCLKECPKTCPGILTDVVLPPCKIYPCIEACVCPEGLVIDYDVNGQKECVKREQCGCLSNGVYYPVGSDVLLNDCNVRCRCVDGGFFKCEDVTCDAPKTCTIIDGAQECVCRAGFIPVDGSCVECDCNGGICEVDITGNPYCLCLPDWATGVRSGFTGDDCMDDVAYCTAYGDPHIVTFDDVKYDYTGECQYVLAQPCEQFADDVKERFLKNFQVVQDIQDGRVVAVYIIIPEYNVEICLRDDEILVNNDDVNLPLEFYDDDGNFIAEIHYIPNGDVIVTTSFGLQLKWNRDCTVELALPKTYHDIMCGMCGDMDGVATTDAEQVDDFFDMNLNLVGSATEFGIEWLFNPQECKPVAFVDNPCASESFILESYCNILTDPNGPFKLCHDVINVTYYSKDCLEDSCKLNEPACKVIAQYVWLCQQAGISIGPWRTRTFCPLECPEGSCYHPCTTQCPPTCLTDISPCTKPCHEGCVCPEGELWSGDKCVKLQDCGCLYRGHYLQPGEGLLNEDCTQQCTCTFDDATGTHSITCVDYACHPDAGCVETSPGINQCQCNDGFIGDGVIDCTGDPCDSVDADFCINGMCVVVNNEPDCICDRGWGGDNCNEQLGDGEVFGDPHYITLDGAYFRYQGDCQYILLQSRCKEPDDTVPYFLIVQDNERLPLNPSVSVTKEIQFVTDDYMVVLDQNLNQVCVTYLATSTICYVPPFSLPIGSTAVLPPISVAYGANSLELTTDYGLIITWYGSSFNVFVPPMFIGKVCGLLGNFDGDASNDFLTPTGAVETNINLYGNSWLHARDEKCTDETKEIYDPCNEDPEKKKLAIEQCNILLDANGPLAPCFEKIKSDVYYEACLYDMCATCDITFLCNDISHYVRQCQDAGVRFTTSWQQEVGCSKVCPPGSHFSTCVAGCPATCTSSEQQCRVQCMEGCKCDEGKVLSGIRCVDVEDCGCVYKGIYYPVGTTFLTDGCTQICTCYAGKGVVCEGFECPINSRCDVDVNECICLLPLIDTEQGCLLDPCTTLDMPCENEGVCVTQPDTADGYSCVCPPGWTGPHCETRIGICKAYGDPHYTTLDGHHYDFQGGCRYILMQHWPDDGTDPLFTVLQENELLGRPVSVTKEIIVKVYGHVITMGRSGLCLVDGLVVTQPHIPGPNPGEFIELRIIGGKKVVSTDFGLEVWWDFNYNVEVIITEDFANQVCGLCGDFDGDGMMSDEFEYTQPDGTTVMTTSPSTYGNWWQDPDFECDQVADPSNDDYDPCAANDFASQAEEKCKILLDPDGPFALCHDLISPQQAYDDCVFDLCVTLPTCDILCSNIQLYAERCLLQGVKIGEWRHLTDCPPVCPANSIYLVQVNVCPPTCYDRLRKDTMGDGGDQPGDQPGDVPGDQPAPDRPADNTERAASTDLTSGAAKEARTSAIAQVSAIDGVLRDLSLPCHRTGVTYCKCLDGLIWSGDKCVEPSDCGCVVDDIYYEAGETFTTPDCNQVCICVGQDRVICRDRPCDPDAVCIPMGGNSTCVCPDGFMGDGFDCVADQCVENPCQNDGICVPVAGGEFECDCAPGWFGQLCEEADPCADNQCQNGGECQVLADGTTGCICPPGWGGPVCDQELNCCYAHGDPHYTTFDGKRYDYQGDCSYILAQLWEDDADLTNFMVIQDNVQWSANSNVAVTNSICIHVYGVEICLGQMLVVTVDGNAYPGATLPAGVTICFQTTKVIVKTDFGLQVSWDGLYNVDVCLPEEYKTKVCGLCGNFDGDPSNDCVDPSGNTVTNLNAYGNSWLHGGTTDCELEPTDTLPYEPCSGNEELEALSVQKCGIINGMGKTCPPGWLPFDDRCYRFINDQPRSQSIAADLCAQLNSDLVEIQSEAENSYVTTELQNLGDGNSDAWLACTDSDTEGTWTCPSGTNHMWVAGTGGGGGGSSNGYFNFGTGEPDNTPDQDCLAMKVNNGVWVSDDCYDGSLNNALCEQASTGSCPPNWTPVSGKCLRLYTGTTSYFTASSTCTNNGGQLALMASASERTDVLAFIDGQDQVLDGVWLRCTDFTTEGTWECPDSDQVYVEGNIDGLWNWGDGNPGNSGDCLQLDTTTGEWNDFRCDGTSAVTVCERPQIEIGESSGPFADCIDVVDPTPFFSDCVYDLCATECAESIYCSAISNYASRCYANFVKVENWRTADFCPLNCPEGSTYNSCMTGCPATCANQNPDPDDCLNPPIEGCECDDGFVLYGATCIPVEECTCQVGNTFYAIGETYITTDCIQLCKCQSGGQFTCVDISCAENADCGTQDGVYGCHCIDGYIGDGTTECTSTGCDPDPCENGGQCESRPNQAPQYVCINCEEGLMGADCSIQGMCDSYTNHFSTNADPNQQGMITSPNYPDFYNKNDIACYQIWVQGANYITLTFVDEFLVESSKDVLYLGPGLGYPVNLNTGPLSTNIGGVYKLDGYRLPGPVTIGSDAVWLYFKTDATINLKGWKINWQAGFDQFIDPVLCWNGYETLVNGQQWDYQDCGITCTCDDGVINCPLIPHASAVPCDVDMDCPGDQMCLPANQVCTGACPSAKYCGGGSALATCAENPKCQPLLFTAVPGQNVQAMCASFIGPVTAPDCISYECTVIEISQIGRKRRDATVQIAALLEVTHSTNPGNESAILDTLAVSIVESIQSRTDDGTLETPIISVEFNGNKFEFGVDFETAETTPDPHVVVKEHPEITVSTSLVATFGSVGGFGVLLLVAVIAAFVFVYRRRQRAIRKFDLREGARNPKAEVIEMLEASPDSDPTHFGGPSPFSTKVILDDGAGGIDNVYAMTYELGNSPPPNVQSRESTA